MEGHLIIQSKKHCPVTGCLSEERERVARRVFESSAAAAAGERMHGKKQCRKRSYLSFCTQLTGAGCRSSC